MRLTAWSPNPAMLAATVMIAGCGSSWDIRKGDSLDVGCAESFFYEDADGDGWGDPASTPEALCQADVDRGLTASNGRDCDDADAGITGLVGTACPDELVTGTGAPVPHGGVVFAESEFAWVYGADAPVVRYDAATIACDGWGGAMLVDDTWESVGTLATFSTQAELVAVEDALSAQLGTEPLAAFVGIYWDGSSLDNGVWAFEDEADDSLIESALNWCGNVEPDPAEFFPLLNPQDPEHVPAINDELPAVRLALVWDGSDFCLGLPIDAGGDSYTTSEAHLICRRPKPDPADYVHFTE